MSFWVTGKKKKVHTNTVTCWTHNIDMYTCVHTSATKLESIMWEKPKLPKTHMKFKHKKIWKYRKDFIQWCNDLRIYHWYKKKMNKCQNIIDLYFKRNITTFCMFKLFKWIFSSTFIELSRFEKKNYLGSANEIVIL